MEEEELKICLEYFQWVGKLADLLESHDERRQILSGASLLFKDSRGDLPNCKQSFKAGTVPAEELMKLGEIEKAWATARLHLEGKIGDRERMLRDVNFFYEPRPHLSRDRLDLYLDPRGGIEGDIRRRIQSHLEHCTECRTACEEREARATRRTASVA
jgi:hypothetical protein